MEYEVKKGDGWYRIAKNLGVNVNDLLQANNAKLDTMLQPGQKLKTSKVAEQPSITSQWQTVAGQNDAAANWVKQRVDTTINNINQALAEQEANEQKIQRKASIGTKGVVQQQAKADTIRLQQALLKEGYDLGRWGADGNRGQATEKAIAQAEKDGWTVDGHRLVKKQPQTTQIPAQVFGAAGPEYAVMAQAQMLKDQSKENNVSVFNTTSNNPFITALEDLIVGSTNKAYRAISGNDDYLIKNRDIYDIPEDQKQILRKRYMDKGGKGNIAWKSSDYIRLQGNYTGGKRSMKERLFTPEGAIEHSLGQYAYTQDPETGDVYMVDTYDWNQGDGSPGQGFYTIARNFMGEFGTKSTDPKGQARKYKVNLGNPQNWNI